MAARTSRASQHLPELLAFLSAASLYLITTTVYLPLPLLDAHAFRQCQTAITASWLAEDLSPLRTLVYETPVMGQPWRIPMEFPLYQWLTACLHRATTWPLDASGKLIALTFHVLCLLPAWAIIRQLGGGFREWAFFASLFLIAPTYHHWSRTFLIESTALFFAATFLSAALGWWATQRIVWFVIATIAAVMAVLVKVTTFPPFAAAAVAYFGSQLWKQRHEHDWRRSCFMAVALAIPFAVALAFLIPWVRYCDAVKEENPLSATLTSVALQQWNYGTLSQRLSQQLWFNVILLRAIPEAIGAAGMLLFLPLLFLARVAARILAGLFATSYLATFLLFTNLHVHHNYYQYANAYILIAALTVVVTSVAEQRPAWLRGVLLTAILGGAVFSTRHYFRNEWQDFSRDPRFVTASFLRRTLPDDAVLSVAGMDWSSEIAFYADCRAVYIPVWMKHDVLKKFVANPATLTGRHNLGALVIVAQGQYPPQWDHLNDELLLRLGEKIRSGAKPVWIGRMMVNLPPKKTQK